MILFGLKIVILGPTSSLAAVGIFQGMLLGLIVRPMLIFLRSKRKKREPEFWSKQWLKVKGSVHTFFLKFKWDKLFDRQLFYTLLYLFLSLCFFLVAIFSYGVIDLGAPLFWLFCAINSYLEPSFLKGLFSKNKI